VPFLPTIGSEAFILSTLATPVPSHDITRELCHLSETFSLSQYPCEVYQMLPQHQARVQVLQVMFSALPFGSHISFRACAPIWCLSSCCPLSLPSVCVCILPSFFRKVSDLSCSFCQKEARVCRSLWYFGLTTHVSIHGGG
jgi:hypothetical protein